MEERIKKFIENIQKQIDRVKNEDSFLLFPPRVYEPAISHKLAEYLQDILKDYNVDVEYDKYGSDSRKELENFKSFCTDNSTDRIRPDIIVHNRGIQIGNILVMEIKDRASSQISLNCVKEKLKRLTKKDELFGYSVGVLWLFGEEEGLFFYVDGIKYNTENEVIEVLTKYEDSSMNNFISYRRSAKELEKKIEIINKEGEKEYEKYEENERIKELEKLEQEIHDQDYYDSINIYENMLDRQEEERLDNLDVDDKYQETGVWGELNEIDGEDNYFSESYFDSEEYKEEQKNEEMGPGEAEIEHWEKQQYELYQEEIIEKYKQGMLCLKDFDYILNEKDSESRKFWFNTWKALYFISHNSVLFNHKWCIKKLKNLLERALTHNGSLYIFKDDNEKRLAEENLEFLNGWVWYQEKILPKKQSK